MGRRRSDLRRRRWNQGVLGGQRAERDEDFPRTCRSLSHHISINLDIPPRRCIFFSYINILTIPQESAIKFVSYEHSKVLLAEYWDQVSDVSELSSSSRFFAGGVGGITSQFSIYGLETLKTRIQTEMGPSTGMAGVSRTVREMWKAGGIRVFYRGLTVSTARSLGDV